MTHEILMGLAVLALGSTLLSACAPAVGAGAVVAADAIAEEEDNDDGLF